MRRRRANRLTDAQVEKLATGAHRLLKRQERMEATVADLLKNAVADLLLRSDGGSVYLLLPVSTAGEAWVADNIPQDAQRWGNDIVVEHRYIGDIVEGAQADGLAVR